MEGRVISSGIGVCHWQWQWQWQGSDSLLVYAFPVAPKKQQSQRQQSSCPFGSPRTSLGLDDAKDYLVGGMWHEACGRHHQQHQQQQQQKENEEKKWEENKVNSIPVGHYAGRTATASVSVSVSVSLSVSRDHQRVLAADSLRLGHMAPPSLLPAAYISFSYPCPCPVAAEKKIYLLRF